MPKKMDLPGARDAAWEAAVLVSVLQTCLSFSQYSEMLEVLGAARSDPDKTTGALELARLCQDWGRSRDLVVGYLCEFEPGARGALAGHGFVP